MRNLIMRAVLVASIAGFGAVGTNSVIAQVFETVPPPATVANTPPPAVPATTPAGASASTTASNPASISASPGASALGISVVDAATIASTLNKPDLRGALVVQVVARSPAGKAGIVNGDIIENFNGTAVLRASDLDADVSGATPDSRVQVGLLRRDKPVWVTIQLISSANPPGAASAVANNPANSAAGYGGKRLAIKMMQSCPADPDPLGILPGNDFYSDCAQEELDKVRGWISASLTSKGTFAEIGDGNPDFILTVTLTQSMATEGAAGAFTDLAPATLEFTATYQLTDSRGQIVKSDTVHYEDGEAYFGGNEDAVEQQFADKIATSVAASSGVSGQPISGTAPPGLTPTPTSTSTQDTHSKSATAPPPPTADKKACNESLFSMVSCTAGQK